MRDPEGVRHPSEIAAQTSGGSRLSYSVLLPSPAGAQAPTRAGAVIRPRRIEAWQVRARGSGLPVGNKTQSHRIPPPLLDEIQRHDRYKKFCRRGDATHYFCRHL